MKEITKRRIEVILTVSLNILAMCLNRGIVIIIFLTLASVLLGYNLGKIENSEEE